MDLACAWTRVDGGELKFLRKFGKLAALYLTCIALRDGDLAELANLGELRKLWINETMVGNLGMKEIAKLEKLNYLNISGTKVTDVGLKELKKLRNLKKLCLSRDEEIRSGSVKFITDSGVADLKRSLPDCKIEWIIHQ